MNINFSIHLIFLIITIAILILSLGDELALAVNDHQFEACKPKNCGNGPNNS